MTPLYEQPVLVIDPGMHTAPIHCLAVDAAGRFAVTGSADKTVRLWSVRDGELFKTIRMPAGPDLIGKIFEVAMTRNGDLVAAAGWAHARAGVIYVIDPHRSAITSAISVGSIGADCLSLSPNGRYLAAGLGTAGLRVFDRNRQWGETFRDTSYLRGVFGIEFADDDRLFVACKDGTIRVYDRNFKRISLGRTAISGREPEGFAVSPDGSKLALAYRDAAAVDVFDGLSLTRLSRPKVEGFGSEGHITRVAWSKDGNTLFAGGGYQEKLGCCIYAWKGAGRGERRALRAGFSNTVAGLAVMPDGDLLVATQDPFLAVVRDDGSTGWERYPRMPDFRAQYDTLGVASNGMVLDFGFGYAGETPLRFDLNARSLSPGRSADGETTRPRQIGLVASRLRRLLLPPRKAGVIGGWENEFHPTLDGKQISLAQGECSRCLAVHPNGNCFVLGTDWYLRAFDANGKLLWRRDTPSVACAVNISGDGRLVIAASADGTLRWHRMDDGRELLALFVLEDKQNWVVWTPEGFYGATPGAYSVLRWHVNRGFLAAAETISVSEIPKLRRPGALGFVLQEMETARALGIADMKAARRDVQIRTRAAKAPGARLHVLAIGVSDYGEKAAGLALQFAHKDAEDVAGALLNTQGGGLYAEVLASVLCDGLATRASIFQALEATERNMARGSGQDMAVVLFSGHGAVIGDQFYLIPHGVDNGTKASLKASAIPALELQREILNLARHGRVLVLLDACRSAGLIEGMPGASLLSSAVAAGNITVLTSSRADKLSREDEAWQHGAFTKVMLDALSADDVDTDRNGVISMTDLTAYVEKRLDSLTGGDQQLGVEQRFQGDIFVVGL